MVKLLILVVSVLSLLVGTAWSSRVFAAKPNFNAFMNDVVREAGRMGIKNADQIRNFKRVLEGDVAKDAVDYKVIGHALEWVDYFKITGGTDDSDKWEIRIAISEMYGSKGLLKAMISTSTDRHVVDYS